MGRVFIVGLCLAVGCLLRDNAQAQSAMEPSYGLKAVRPVRRAAKQKKIFIYQY
jgi:hypothetical protein